MPEVTKAKRLPAEAELRSELPDSYLEKLDKLEFSPVIDNTLRRVRAGARTYPSRLKPARERDLVAADGEALTYRAEGLLAYLDRFLGDDGYPEALLE